MQLTKTTKTKMKLKRCFFVSSFRNIRMSIEHHILKINILIYTCDYFILIFTILKIIFFNGRLVAPRGLDHCGPVVPGEFKSFDKKRKKNPKNFVSFSFLNVKKTKTRLRQNLLTKN